jgi:4-carboxymuconolactone decarboxylase
MSRTCSTGNLAPPLAAIVLTFAALWTTADAQPAAVQTPQASAQNAVAGSLERMQPIPLEKMTPAQRKTVEEYAKTRPGSSLNGNPWMTMLRVPEIVIPALEMRLHLLSSQAALPPRLVEFATLISAAEWTNNFEWGAHSQAAIKAGVKPQIIQALAEGRRPSGMAEDEEIIYDLCTELFKHQSVSDYTYARALARFGEPGIVETAHITGLYTMLAMIMNVARVQARFPEGSQPPLVPFPHTLPVPTVGRSQSQ